MNFFTWSSYFLIFYSTSFMNLSSYCAKRGLTQGHKLVHTHSGTVRGFFWFLENLQRTPISKKVKNWSMHTCPSISNLCSFVWLFLQRFSNFMPQKFKTCNWQNCDEPVWRRLNGWIPRPLIATHSDNSGPTVNWFNRSANNVHFTTKFLMRYSE